VGDASFVYRLYGLLIGSDLPLPELSPAACAIETFDVRLALATLPAALPMAPGLHQLADGMLLNMPDAGRYWVRHGRSLLIEPLPDAPERNVRLYLLGSALGLLLHQRGLLPLHASSLSVEGKGIAFVGSSGAGKSTLAAHFLERGFDLLADDVSVVEPWHGDWLIQPGVRRLRLWGETLRQLGRSPSRYERAYAGDDSWDKYEIGVEGDAAIAVPLRAIYLLDRGDGGSVERQGPVDAVEILFGNTYRGHYLAWTGLPERHMRQCVALARAVPVFRWRRSCDVGSLSSEVDRLLAHFRSL